MTHIYHKTNETLLLISLHLTQIVEVALTKLCHATKNNTQNTFVQDQD